MSAKLTAAEQRAFDDMEAALADDSSSQETVREVTVLETWLSVLSNIETVREEKISPSDALRTVALVPGLPIQEVTVVNELFSEMLLHARRIIELEIADDPDALMRGGSIDAEGNWAHYANIYLQWRTMLVAEEKRWDINGPYPLAHIAAITRAANFLFGQGLTSFLDQIGFEFNEEDEVLVSDASIGEEDQ